MSSFDDAALDARTQRATTETRDRAAEQWADECERAARAMLLAIGCCPDHGEDMIVVRGRWVCGACERSEYYESEG